MPVRSLIVLWTLLLLAAGCATSPLGRSQLMLMPASQVDAMGVEAYNTLKKENPLEQDPKINAYVRCVTNAIIPEIAGIMGESVGTWEVSVFRDDDPNAFALPGNKIGVHTGLLKVAENQHQLATVIGHEIAHVLAKHGNERVSQQTLVQVGMDMINAVAQPQTQTGQTLLGLLGVGAQFGILMPFSRKQESEADMLGLDLMAKAGFDPRESIKLWLNMEKAGGGSPPEFLSTHPSHDTRIQDLNQRLLLTLGYYDRAQAAGKVPRCGP